MPKAARHGNDGCHRNETTPPPSSGWCKVIGGRAVSSARTWKVSSVWYVPGDQREGPLLSHCCSGRRCRRKGAPSIEKPPKILSPWHNAHVAHAGAVLLVDWHECVHPVVASPLLEVPSAENPMADCPLAHHLNASTGRLRCRRQC